MRPLAWGYAMLMSLNEDETAVYGCHCLGDMVVRVRKVLGPYRGVDTCATVLKLELFDFMLDIDENVVRRDSLIRVQCFCCRWYGSTYAWCPFGQDVRVTPRRVDKFKFKSS